MTSFSYTGFRRVFSQVYTNKSNFPSIFLLWKNCVLLNACLSVLVCKSVKLRIHENCCHWNFCWFLKISLPIRWLSYILDTMRDLIVCESKFLATFYQRLILVSILCGLLSKHFWKNKKTVSILKYRRWPRSFTSALQHFSSRKPKENVVSENSNIKLKLELKL